MEALFRYDADDNGLISNKELPIGYNFHLAFSLSDENSKGTISTKELKNPKFFVTFLLYDNNLDGTTTINGSVKPNHRITFFLNGDNSITEELGTLMWDLGLDYSEAEIQDLLDHVESAGKEASYCRRYRSMPSQKSK